MVTRLGFWNDWKELVIPIKLGNLCQTLLCRSAKLILVNFYYLDNHEYLHECIEKAVGEFLSSAEKSCIVPSLAEHDRILNSYNMQYYLFWLDYIMCLLTSLHDDFFLYCPLDSSQRKDQGRCRKECAETVSKLQKKNQELQRHLEKACRQLQHSVREHKTALQQLKGIFPEEKCSLNVI